MKKTKKDYFDSLSEIAGEILSLDEYPAVPKNAGLKQKLDSHSSKWTRAFRDFVGNAFHFAKFISYPASLYEKSGFSSKEDLVSNYSASVMTLSYRLLAKKAEKTAEEIVSYFEAVLPQEIEHEIQSEAKKALKENTGLSDRKIRIFFDYNRFKTNVEMIAKNRKDLSEEKIQLLYLSTSNTYGIQKEELEKIIEDSERKIVLESDTIFENEDGESDSILESAETSIFNSEFDENDEKRYEELFRKIEAVFEGLQERTKDYVSALVTLNLLKELEKIEKSRPQIADMLKKYSFVEKNRLNLWKDYKDLDNQKEIGMTFKKNSYEKNIEKNAESDASRTYKSFLKKLSAC